MSKSELLMNKFKNLPLFCKHDYSILVKVIRGWFPTLRTTNGVGDEDERLIQIECSKCGKRKRVTQTRSFGSIKTYQNLKKQIERMWTYENE